MNKQEVFDKVAKHLLQQNARSATANDFCEYRGKTGLMCAVGCLIPDVAYSPGIEGMGVVGLIDHYRRQGAVMLHLVEDNGLTVDNSQMLVDLQYLHDKMPVHQWQDKLAEIAKQYNLVMVGE